MEEAQVVRIGLGDLLQASDPDGRPDPISTIGLTCVVRCIAGAIHPTLRRQNLQC